MNKKSTGIKDVKFSEMSSYRGRNGAGKMSGLGIQAYEMGEAKIIVLNPITSRNEVSDAAVLRIPEKEIPQVIDALRYVTGQQGVTTAQIRELEDKVLTRWEGRRQHQGYSKTTKTGKQLQCEFLMGMLAAFEAIYGDGEKSLISPRIMFSIMRGDYIEAPEAETKIKIGEGK